MIKVQLKEEEGNLSLHFIGQCRLEKYGYALRRADNNVEPIEPRDLIEAVDQYVEYFMHKGEITPLTARNIHSSLADAAGFLKRGRASQVAVRAKKKKARLEAIVTDGEAIIAEATTKLDDIVRNSARVITDARAALIELQE